jgi:RNA polymerase sigma-70 factor (ECF subfamily)
VIIVTGIALRNELDTEREWIARAQAGDKAAYGHLVQRYQRLVVSVAYRHGLDLAEAEDVAQETFVKAWLALPRYRESAGSLRAWLCRIAINTTRDVHRRERPAQELDEHMPDSDHNPADQAEAQSKRWAVRRALDQLPAASRAALVLREYEGLSYAEIADALGIPLGTVMSRLNYARSRLRELLMEAGEVG